VKELALQTSRATEDIGQRIAGIRGHSLDSVDAVTAIAGIVDTINGSQTSIAAAVEEQSITIAEINRNISEVAKGGQIMTEDLGELSKMADANQARAELTLKAAFELVQITQEIDQALLEGLRDKPAPAALAA